MEELILMFFGYFIVGGLISLALYILQSICLSAALKNIGHPNSWMAWIPLLNYYTFASIVERDEFNNVNVAGLNVPGVVYNFWWVISYAASFVPTIGSLLGMFIQVACLGTSMIHIYSKVFGTSKEQEQVVGYCSGLILFISIFRLWNVTFKKGEKM